MNWLVILGATAAFGFVFSVTMLVGFWLADRNRLQVEWADEVDDALF